jgi:selenocysteine-specific translation elongation factor
MPNLNVSVLGSQGYSRALGKKGTESDVTFYNLKRGEDTVTMLEPTRYPEKLASLFYSASFGDLAVIVVERLDAAFGESVLMLTCAGVERGFVVLRNYITPEQIGNFSRGTALKGYEVVEDDPVWLRERLLKEAGAASGASDSFPGTVVVDHSFNVGGIGAVALGVVRQGTVSRHDSLLALPSGKTAQVRSIQKHDDGFESASTGDRVGLALKNVDVSDVSRGTVLASEGSMRTTSVLEAEAEVLPYWANPLRESMVLHLGHWMQFVPARLESVEENGGSSNPSLRISLDKPLVHPPGSRAVITQLDGGNLRVVGTVGLPH